MRRNSTGEAGSKKKVLIVGGNGYLGSELGRLLTARGDVVCCYDQRWDSFYEGRHYIGDIQDARSLAEVFEQFRPAVVVHLSAVVGAPACEKDPVNSTSVNVGGTLILSKTMGRRCPVIFSSSDSVYGPQSNHPVKEDAPARPVSLYAIQKRLAEEILLFYNDAVVLRFVTGFGVSVNMRDDLLFHTLVRDGLAGNDIVVSEPEAVRSFVHVRDMASACMSAIDMADRMAGQVHNVGSPAAQLTKLQFARLVAEKTGVPYVIGDTFRDLDKRDCVLSFQKLYDLGWQPRICIEEGIDELAMFYAARKAVR